MTTPNKCKGTVHTTMCEGPNPQLQALIKKANDKRSLWTKTKDFFSGAWDGTKRIYDASKNDLENTAWGFAKGVGNLPTDLWNLAVLGYKYTGPIPPALQADALNYAALQAYQGGDTATANAMASRASEMMEAGYASDLFEIKGDAQKGGSVASMVFPVGAVVKGAGAAAKVLRVAKTGDAAADAAKAADIAADAGRGADDASKATTGAAVLALTPAQILRRKAIQSEPQITKDIGDASKRSGGVQEGLENRIKSEESLTRKINDGTDPTKINDALRYTVTHEPSNLGNGANAVMTGLKAAGYEQVAVSNTFREGAGYMGINTTYRSPTGQLFELQFHTPQSFAIKDGVNHSLYEVWRLDSTPISVKQDLMSQMIRNSSVIEIPPGIRQQVPPRRGN